MKITILGSGGWGTALACTLKKNSKRDVLLWSLFENEIEDLKKYNENKAFLPGVKLPEEIQYSSDLKYSIGQADIVIFAVPSFAMRETAKKAAEFFNPEKQIAVCVAKGLEDSSFMTLGEVIESELPKNSRVCALSGPTHAEEVARDIPTTIVAAARDIKTAETVQSAMMNDKFRIYTSDDMKGVELGGTIKNIIALCAGISDGCGFGDNAKAALMTRGIHEISRLGVAMGGKRETFYGLSGIGDLIVTCTSMHSRNRRCGILIGKGMKADDAMKEVNMVVEGIKCLKAVYNAAKKCNVEMPIINEAYDVIYNNKSPLDCVSALMTREKRPEL